MRGSRSPTGSLIAISKPSPARLGHAGDHPLIGEITQDDTSEVELAVVTTRTTGHLATVGDSGRVPVAGKLRHAKARDQTLALVQALVGRDRLQLRVLRSSLLDERAAALVLQHGTQFRHDLSSLSSLRGLLLFGLLFLREGEAEETQQLASFVVGVGAGRD